MEGERVHVLGAGGIDLLSAAFLNREAHLAGTSKFGALSFCFSRRLVISSDSSQPSYSQ